MINFSPGLDETERQSLQDALDDEYKAHAVYDQVVRDFGPVRPFINIVEAEVRHASTLLALFDKYEIAAPPNRWLGKAPRFSSVQDACGASIQGEIENVALYDRLLKNTHRPDILSVFQALRSASQDRHLPAFQCCAGHSNQGAA